MSSKMKGLIKKPWLSQKFVTDKLKETVGNECLSVENFNSRIHPYPDERNQWYYFLYRYTNLSLDKIGALLGGKNHATVLHGIRKYKNTELIKRKDGSFLYSGKTQDMHLILTDIFEKKVRKNKNYLDSKGLKLKDVIETDFLIIQQREIIGKLLQTNLKLMEQIKDLKEKIPVEA